MIQKLEYINKSRGGIIIYKDDQEDLKFEFEYGGGNCVVIIYVPTIYEWKTQTDTKNSDRNSILAFIAEQAIKDQVPNGFYKLSDNCIKIFNGENV